MKFSLWERESNLSKLVLICIVLISGLPFILFFDTPFSFSSISSLHDTSRDPYYYLRYTIITAGFILALLSTFLLVSNLLQESVHLNEKYKAIVFWLIIFHLGWKDYPFWVNGLHHVNASGGDYDPKLLLPITSFYGSCWYFGVILFYFLTFFAPVYLIAGWSFGRLSKIHFFRLMMVWIINISLFSLTPSYLEWLLD